MQVVLVLLANAGIWRRLCGVVLKRPGADASMFFCVAAAAVPAEYC